MRKGAKKTAKKAKAPKRAATSRTSRTSRTSSSSRARSLRNEARAPQNEGEALGELLDRIQRKGERRIKEVIAQAVGPRLQEGLAGAFDGLQMLDKLLGDDDEEDEEDERSEEE